MKPEAQEAACVQPDKFVDRAKTRLVSCSLASFNEMLEVAVHNCTSCSYVFNNSPCLCLDSVCPVQHRAQAGACIFTCATKTIDSILVDLAVPERSSQQLRRSPCAWVDLQWPFRGVRACSGLGDAGGSQAPALREGCVPERKGGLPSHHLAHQQSDVPLP